MNNTASSVLANFHRNDGSTTAHTFDTVEAAILAFRVARRSRKLATANRMEYSVDGGTTWLK